MGWKCIRLSLFGASPDSMGTFQIRTCAAEEKPFHTIWMNITIDNDGDEPKLLLARPLIESDDSPLSTFS